MAKKVNQIRYYKDNMQTQNYPNYVSARTLQSGSIFHDTLPIVRLNIQTLPGAKIYINNHPNPVVIGQNGVYELSTDGVSYITDLRFSIDTLINMNNNENVSCLIIDYVYEEQD